MIEESNITASLTCGRLTIDLDALAENWRLMNHKVGEAECAAMVKADAYGITIEKSVYALEKAGCKTFFVATPEEGMAVRALSQNAIIYVLNGLLPGAASAYSSYRLRPVLNTREEVDEWADNNHPAALHIDTGMNRLGLSEGEARALSDNKALVDRLNLSLIMSHLACGDTPAAPMNLRQLSLFKALGMQFAGIPLSLCNSAGVFQSADFHMNMVRPGIALYGGAALQEHMVNNPMRPVVKAEARILQIRTVRQNESIGYGAAYVARKDCKIATISAGYADGYNRLGGATNQRNGASGYLHGKRVALTGRVSMDLITVDVSHVPNVKRGDFVELFGPHIPISDVASCAKTIDYEYLTGLGKRYARAYGPLT